MCRNERGRSSSVLLELPVSVVEGADLTCLEPTRDAVKVEGVLRQCQYCLVEMGHGQCRLTLQMPHATVHSSLVAEA